MQSPWGLKSEPEPRSKAQYLDETICSLRFASRAQKAAPGQMTFASMSEVSKNHIRKAMSLLNLHPL